MSFAVQICSIIALAVFATWVVIISIFVINKLESHKSTIGLVIFDILSGGYFYLKILIIASLKLFTLNSKKQMPWATKLLLTFAFLIIGGVGAAIIALTEGGVWGHVLCSVCAYLVSILYLHKWLK
jgi:hypothetical protein